MKKQQMIPLANIPNIGKLADYLEDTLEKSGGILNFLLDAKAREEGIPDDERLSPDTFGSERVFLDFFINEDMEDDFPLIARDFLLHEYNNLTDHEDVEYLDIERGCDWPERVFNRFVLNFMMNAVNSGSDYAKALFRNLYKTYYKKEYNSLKKFNTLSASELLSLAKPDEINCSYFTNLARILFIAKISGIRISRDCNYIYECLNEMSRQMDAWGCFDFDEATGESYKECRQEIEEKYDINKLYELDARASRFLGNSLQWAGYSPEYVEVCDDEEDGLIERLGLALSIFKKTFPGKEYTEEDIVLYGTILHTARALTCNASWLVSQLGIIAYGEKYTDFYDHFPSQFRPVDGAMQSSGAGNKEKEEKKPKLPEEPKYREETLVAELDALRRKVHKLENDNDNLRTDIADSKKHIEDNREMKDQLDAAIRELAALRSYVYNLTEEEQPESKVSLEEMTESIGKLRVVIIGGHTNWVNKLKNRFPDWVFVSPDASGTPDVDIVDKADHVYFFSETISHSAYFRFLNVIRERKVDFGYIHGVNIDKNTRQIYKELVERSK